MPKQPNKAGQPNGGGKPKGKQAATREAGEALACAAEAHGVAGAKSLPWTTLLPLIFKLIEALTGGDGGGVTAQVAR